MAGPPLALLTQPRAPAGNLVGEGRRVTGLRAIVPPDSGSAAPDAASPRGASAAQ